MSPHNAAAGVQTQVQPNLRGDQLPLSARFWWMLLCTGVGAGLAGGLLMRLLHWVEQTSFGYRDGDFLAGTIHASATRKLLVLLLAGVVAGLGGLLAARLRGSTELTSAVWQRDGRLPLRKASIRALYSIVIVGMGAAVGRENALKQAGAILANLAADWRALPDDQRQLLVACGGGAGMAAAYNVPLGGAVFALEVLLGSFSLRCAVPVFATSMLATWVSWLLLPDVATYSFTTVGAAPQLILWSAVAGPVCGLVAVPFIRLVGWARASKAAGWQVFVYPLASLTLLGAVSIRYPEMLGNGKDVIQLALRDAGPTSLLLVLLLLRPVATALILRSGVPGGLFTPTMSLGAVAGALLGRLWSVLPGQSAAGSQAPACALIGSAAVLSAANQAPVSSMIFVLELTRTADSVMVPLLIAVVSATLVVRHFERRSIDSIDSVNSTDEIDSSDSMEPAAPAGDLQRHALRAID